jgi:GT2 family glycosyltransferase
MAVDPAVDVTVSIVNWNGERWLRDCLKSVQESGNVRVRVIVVDNASSDHSTEIVHSEFPAVQLIINDENVGYGTANNQAIVRGAGRYFFVLNNDTVLKKDCLSLLKQFLDANPSVGMVSAQLINADETPQFAYFPVTLPSLASLTADLLWLNRVWPRSRLGRGKASRDWDANKASRMEQIPGACMLMRREFLEEVGLFDETFRFWYEDVDLCARTLRTKWEMWYLPEAKIFHLGMASTKLMDLSARSLLRFRSMLQYARKYFSYSQYCALRFIIIVILALRFPIVAAAAVWPNKKTRALWKGAWKAYLQLISEVAWQTR